jgi:hypothetical protein
MYWLRMPFAPHERPRRLTRDRDEKGVPAGMTEFLDKVVDKCLAFKCKALIRHIDTIPGRD